LVVYLFNMKYMLGVANNMKIRHVGSVASFALLISGILVLYGEGGIQSSYGQQVVKTLHVKVQLDKSVIARGNTQTIQFRVVDANTGQPVSGAITRATVKYAGSEIVRQFATTTDASGQSSISWQIESDATPGAFSVTYDVSAATYVEESFDATFAVVIHSINDDNGDHHHHHHN